MGHRLTSRDMVDMKDGVPTVDVRTGGGRDSEIGPVRDRENLIGQPPPENTFAKTSLVKSSQVQFEGRGEERMGRPHIQESVTKPEY